jgi:hypothetical protein
MSAAGIPAAFLMVAAFSGSVSPAGATEVFFTDFNSGAPLAFTAPGCVVESVQGFSGYGTNGNVFDTQFLRYNALTIFATTLELADLPPHDSVSISFLLAIIDSWDGTELLEIRVDGNLVFSNWFQLASGDASSYVPPDGGLLTSGTNLGFTGGTWYNHDRAYDMGLEPALQNIPHTAETLTVVWSLSAVSGSAAQNWQGGTDESWAIDNVRVEVFAAPTGIGDTPTPPALTLLSNTPNPFSEATSFRLYSPKSEHARVDVFDVSGRRVWSNDVAIAAGWQDLVFAGRGDRNQRLPAGVYFYRLRTRDITETRKMVLTR